MIIRKKEFNKSFCIPEVAINEFIKDNFINKENIINIIPFKKGVELWYWD